MPHHVIIIRSSNMWGYFKKNMLSLNILSTRIDEMIKNPALKLKNILFNLNVWVLLALYLEYFFLTWSYISWCMNISGIISNAERKQTTSTKTCNYESQPLKPFTPTCLYKLSASCFSLQKPRFVTRVVHFVLVADKAVLGHIFSRVFQFHCVSIMQPVVHILSIIILQMDNGQIRGCSFRRHSVLLIQE